MFYRILCICVSLIFGASLYSPVSAACSNDGVITESNFKLDLGCMDPMNEGQNATGKYGVEVLKELLENISDILLFTIPILAGLSLLIAGYFYIFSAGDSEKVGRAKTIIKWNIIAILVAFLSYGIVRIIASFFDPSSN